MEEIDHAERELRRGQILWFRGLNRIQTQVWAAPGARVGGDGDEGRAQTPPSDQPGVPTLSACTLPSCARECPTSPIHWARGSHQDHAHCGLWGEGWL